MQRIKERRKKNNFIMDGWIDALCEPAGKTPTT
jgi:hypothetical protein